MLGKVNLRVENFAKLEIDGSKKIPTRMDNVNLQICMLKKGSTSSEKL